MPRHPLTVVLAAAVLFAAACGGDGAGDPASPTSAAPSTATTEPTHSAGGIDGPLLHVSAAGTYAIDRESGEARLLQLRDVEGADVNTAPAVEGDTAWVLTYDTLEGESFSHNVYLTRIDRATGGDERLASFGADRESDDAETLVQHQAVAALAGDGWVLRNVFGERDRDLVRIDGDSGEVRVVATRPLLRHLASDGEFFYTFTEEGLERFDPASETFETLIPPGSRLEDLVAPGLDVEPLFITREGAPPSEDALDAARRRFVEAASIGANGEAQPLAVGDGGIWFGWSASFSAADGTYMVGEGLLRFDLATRQIDAAVPTVGYGDHFPDENTIALAGHGGLLWEGGALWVVEPEANGAILRVGDGLTAEVVYEPCNAEFLCDSASAVTFNRTDPGHVWLQVVRFVDEGEGSRVGEIFLERLDTATGELALSVPVADLIGF